MVVAIAGATVIAILLVATIAIYLRQGGPLAIGLSDFEERKKFDTGQVVSNCFRIQIKKFHFVLLLFNSPQKIVTVTKGFLTFSEKYSFLRSLWVFLN